MQVCKIIILDDRLQVPTHVQADVLFPKVRIPGTSIKYIYQPTTYACIRYISINLKREYIHLIDDLTYIYFLSLTLYRSSRLFRPGNCPQVGNQNSRNKLIVQIDHTYSSNPGLDLER